jgi:hypothetical protein
MAITPVVLDHALGANADYIALAIEVATGNTFAVGKIPILADGYAGST